MLTKTNPDGTWSCQGVDFKEVNGNLYGALCKLRDYEKSGFEPEDLNIVKGKVHIGLCICIVVEAEKIIIALDSDYHNNFYEEVEEEIRKQTKERNLIYYGYEGSEEK